jgi:hypothetical protein
MIRKNDPKLVSELTASAATMLKALDSNDNRHFALKTVMTAMATVSKLTGVGPATASLILSVYRPYEVPFFQDELYAWCFPEEKDGKLKYDLKEYKALFERCWEVNSKISGEFGVGDLEKASFVVCKAGSGERVSEDESKPSKAKREANRKPELATAKVNEAKGDAGNSNSSNNQPGATAATKRSATSRQTPEEASGQRRSKRNKK